MYLLYIVRDLRFYSQIKCLSCFYFFNYIISISHIIKMISKHFNANLIFPYSWAFRMFPILKNNFMWCRYKHLWRTGLCTFLERKCKLTLRDPGYPVLSPAAALEKLSEMAKYLFSLNVYQCDKCLRAGNHNLYLWLYQAPGWTEFT